MRRRYDTEALVGDTKRERRHGIVLIVLGATILVALAFYFTLLRGPSVPELRTAVVPAPVVPAAVATPAQPTPAQASPAPAATPIAEPPAPAAPVDATLVVTLMKPGPLWIDGELVEKKAKNHTTKLSPGKHKVWTKAGKKQLAQLIEAEAGKRYLVELDLRKRKPELKVE